MMKKIIQIFYLFLAVFTVTFTGCRKDNTKPVTELSIDGDQKTITVENNGVGIEFCLLNEQGEPATVFHEGENFKFHLAIRNNAKQDTALFIVSKFLRNPGLFRVFNSNGDTIGQPAEWNGLFKISDGMPRLYRGKEWVLEFPWHETRGMKKPFDPYNSIRVLQHFFVGLDQVFLQKGKYYTKFTQQFCLGRYVDPRTDFFCTDTLTFTINFEIE